MLSRRTFALQDILLGLNAQISYDLPLSLLDTVPWDVGADLLEMRRRDFETLNDVLAEAIDDVQREAAWADDPTLGVLDADRLSSMRIVEEPARHAFVRALFVGSGSETRHDVLIHCPKLLAPTGPWPPDVDHSERR